MLFSVPEYAVVTAKPSKQKKGSVGVGGGEGGAGWGASVVGRWAKRARSRGRDEEDPARPAGENDVTASTANGRESQISTANRRQSQTSDLYEILALPTASYSKGTEQNQREMSHYCVQ
jgi:hypothetical protein